MADADPDAGPIVATLRLPVPVRHLPGAVDALQAIYGSALTFEGGTGDLAGFLVFREAS